MYGHDRVAGRRVKPLRRDRPRRRKQQQRRQRKTAAAAPAATAAGQRVEHQARQISSTSRPHRRRNT